MIQRVAEFIIDRFPPPSPNEYRLTLIEAAKFGIHPKEEWPRRKQVSYCCDMLRLIMTRSRT